MSKQEYLTSSQAARRLGVSAERVRQLARSGELPYTSTPLGRLIPRGAVEALAAERALRELQAVGNGGQPAA